MVPYLCQRPRQRANQSYIIIMCILYRIKLVSGFRPAALVYIKSVYLTSPKNIIMYCRGIPIFIIFLFFLPGTLFPQLVNWTQSWTPAFTHYDGNTSGRQIAISPFNEVYITGLFDDSVDFDYGPDTNILFTPDVATFLAKLDSSGNLVWVRKFEGTGYFVTNDMVVDGDGNIIMSGQYTQVMDLDPGPDSTWVDGGLGSWPGIIKLDSSGNLIWYNYIGNDTVAARVWAIAI